MQDEFAKTDRQSGGEGSANLWSRGPRLFLKFDRGAEACADGWSVSINLPRGRKKCIVGRSY